MGHRPDAALPPLAAAARRAAARLLLLLVLLAAAASPIADARRLQQATPTPLQRVLARFMTNAELQAHMADYARRCARIAKLHTIGFSVKQAPLLALEISKNGNQTAAVEDGRPHFKVLCGGWAATGPACCCRTRTGPACRCRARTAHHLAAPDLASPPSCCLSTRWTALLCLFPPPLPQYIANMHGDETGGRQLLLALAEWLCANPSAPKAKQIIDGMHLWLLPTVNPDGYAARWRGNA